MDEAREKSIRHRGFIEEGKVINFRLLSLETVDSDSIS